LAKGVKYLREQTEAKPDAEKPANAEEKPKAENKPEPKKEGAAIQRRLGPAYVDAILEWFQIQPGRLIQAV
jgi:hypothetical protein